MNAAFFTALETRLTELTTDLRFLHQPTNELIAPRIVNTMLERPTEEQPEGDEYPLVRWVIYAGEFAWHKPAPFSVMLDGGIYTAGSIADGTRDIAALTMALGKIVQTPWFAPYKLHNQVRFALGSPEQNSLGIQPHPYYFTRLYLDFVVASGHGG